MSHDASIGHSRSAVPPFRRELLAPRYWPAWGLAGLLSLFQLLPRPLRDAVGSFAGRVQYRSSDRRREIARTNVGLCFPHEAPDQREQLIRDHFRAFGRAVVDLPRLWWDFRGRFGHGECRFLGLDIVRRERRAGRSVILLNPHTVAVDFGGAALSRHFRMTTMFNPLGHPVADWLMAGTRARYGTLFSRDDGLRPVIRALRAGTVFYYMPDEDLGGRDSVFAPFFGQPKATLSTLARLARVGPVSVVPMVAFYDPEHRCYQIELLPPLERFPSGDAVADAAAMNRALERAIRRCPEAYLWTYRLFHTRPDGGPSLYRRRKRR